MFEAGINIGREYTIPNLKNTLDCQKP